MRVIVLTSGRFSIASNVLSILCENKNIEIVKVVLAHGVSPNKKKNIKRKIFKIFQIGFLGALNGIRIRKWYIHKNADDIYSICQKFIIELSETPFINCNTTKELFQESNADLGLSLGNGYIPESVFSIPKYGMINIHTEILPKYQGAQSIIWPIYEREKETGFTIHQIDKNIDTGNIIYQEKYPIQFYSTLQNTVEENLRTAHTKIPKAFSYVCENYASLKDSSESQEVGKSYTTPSIWQFLRMLKNNRAFYKNATCSKP